MKDRKIIRLSKLPEYDVITELIEYMIYYKLSYPIGNKDTCEVRLIDSSCEIVTPNTIYKMTDEVYLYLYLLSNKAIANIYKVIKDD